MFMNIFSYIPLLGRLTNVALLHELHIHVHLPRLWNNLPQDTSKLLFERKLCLTVRAFCWHLWMPPSEGHSVLAGNFTVLLTHLSVKPLWFTKAKVLHSTATEAPVCLSKLITLSWKRHDIHPLTLGRKATHGLLLQHSQTGAQASNILNVVHKLFSGKILL